MLDRLAKMIDVKRPVTLLLTGGFFLPAGSRGVQSGPVPALFYVPRVLCFVSPRPKIADNQVG